MKNKLNRYLNEEKMQNQFDKKCVSLDGEDKIFEIAMMGSGEPTVVLINGAGGPIEGWMKCWPLFDGSFTVFAYNRMGVGNSGTPTEPQTAVNMAKDLRSLLSVCGLKPPFFLVGHSLGGFIAQAYSIMYPQDVNAILFLESSTVDDVQGSKGMKKIQTPSDSSFSELNCVSESVEQLKGLGSFPQVPIIVIAGFHPIGKMFLPRSKFQKRFEHQKKLLELTAESQLIVATKSGHFPQMNEPKLVVETIDKQIKK